MRGVTWSMLGLALGVVTSVFKSLAAQEQAKEQERSITQERTGCTLVIVSKSEDKYTHSKCHSWILRHSLIRAIALVQICVLYSFSAY